MQKIGEIFRARRKHKRLSISDVSKGTKIKEEFVLAIEKGLWSTLPEYPVLIGFIKNIADFLGVDNKRAQALFKRDYPPQRLQVNPKPDVAQRFVWSPKLTFFLGSMLLVVIILGYLVFQYIGSIRSPELALTAPAPNSVLLGTEFAVVGTTNPDATITINDQPILVSADGTFSEIVEVASNTTALTVVATSRNGKVTEINIPITIELSR